MRPDSERTRRRLVTLLSRYVVEGESEARSNFSVRAPGRFLSRDPGALYVAGGEVMTTRRWDELAQALIGHLSGIAAGLSPQDGDAPVVEGRVLEANGQAVIVTTSCAGPLAVGAVAELGGREVSVWHPVIEPVTGCIAVPAPLDGLDWSQAGLTPPGPVAPLPVVGVVACESSPSVPAVVAAWTMGRRALDAWGAVLSDLDHAQRVRVGCSPDEVISASAELLTAG